MLEKIQNFHAELSEQLSFLELEIDDTIIRCEKSIEIILSALEKVRSLILKTNFKTE